MGFLLLRKRASCAICDCTRLRRRTPYHGADASLLRVNSPAPLLNESSSSANKTDKPFACPFCLMHYVRGIRTRALRKRHGASFLAAARRLLQSIKTADQGCFAKDKNESLFLRQAKRTSENACPFCLIHYVRGIRTRALRKRHSASFLAAARKRREKQALAFAEIERSGHSQQPDTKCQMQGISAKARLLSVDRRLLRVITLSHH